MSDQQEQQSTEKWVQRTCTGLGFFLITGVSFEIALHVKYQDLFPKPVDIDAGLLFGIGVVLLLLFNLPWTKIRIGEIEIERAIEEQAVDHANEVGELKALISSFEQLSNSAPVTEEMRNRVNAVTASQAREEIESELLLRFLEQWSTWGFTASRIRSWGGRQAGFEALGKLSVSHIRTLAANLIRDGKIRTKISKSSNILYQADRV